MIILVTNTVYPFQGYIVKSKIYYFVLGLPSHWTSLLRECCKSVWFSFVRRVWGSVICTVL